MDEEELLKKLRSLGVKFIEYEYWVPKDGRPQQLLSKVDFFPRDLLDLDSIVPGEATPTDRAPPAIGEDGQPNIPPVRIPASIAAILRKGSVS